MTPRLCCVHIDQLITYPAVYTLMFDLQFCYKPLGILQRITKSVERLICQVMMDFQTF